MEDIKMEKLNTPEDFTDEQQMNDKTTEEFINKEVLPKMEHLENQELEHTVDLLKKAGGLGLLSADVPKAYGGLALDAISSSLITEKFSVRSEEHTSELQSRFDLVCRLLLEKKNIKLYFGVIDSATDC